MELNVPDSFLIQHLMWLPL